MTDDQVSDVRDLTRKAGIKPTITRARPGDPLLEQLAPGERTVVAATARPAAEPAATGALRSSSGCSPGRRRSQPGWRRSSIGLRLRVGLLQRRRLVLVEVVVLTVVRTALGGRLLRRGTAQSGRAHSAAGFSSSRRGR